MLFSGTKNEWRQKWSWLAAGARSPACCPSETHKSTWHQWINQHNNYDSLIPQFPHWEREKGIIKKKEMSKRGMKKRQRMVLCLTDRLGGWHYSLNKREESIIKRERQREEERLRAYRRSHWTQNLCYGEEPIWTETDWSSSRKHSQSWHFTLTHCLWHTFPITPQPSSIIPAYWLKAQRQGEAETSSVLLQMFYRGWERQSGTNTHLPKNSGMPYLSIYIA